ncbi:DUF7512 family protein [Halomarina ordinaria]|uniref:ABC transporter permease n=1 Tax=Halomarina ordinaria TaxID=3033939 RepID=A0ABD5UE95_9EURY|nr:hypothetical protein [Halomarina sp. PSRA2]
MFGIETLSGSSQAVVLVGLVLAESLVLYAGYGGVTRVAAPHLERALGGE